MLIEVHELPHIIIFNDLFKLWSTVIHTNTFQHVFLWSECLRCFNNSSLNRFTTVQCRVGGIFLSRALFLLSQKTRECLVFTPKEISTLCYDEFTVSSESKSLSIPRSFVQSYQLVRLNKYLFSTAATDSAVKIFCKVDWFHEMKKVSISVCFYREFVGEFIKCWVWDVEQLSNNIFVFENSLRVRRHWNITKHPGCIKIWHPQPSRSIKQCIGLPPLVKGWIIIINKS